MACFFAFAGNKTDSCSDSPSSLFAGRKMNNAVSGFCGRRAGFFAFHLSYAAKYKPRSQGLQHGLWRYRVAANTPVRLLRALIKRECAARWNVSRRVIGGLNKMSSLSLSLSLPLPIPCGRRRRIGAKQHPFLASSIKLSRHSRSLRSSDERMDDESS